MNDVKYPELPAPDSYLFQHDETGLTQYVDAQQVEWGFEAINPRLRKVSGAYSESQMRSYADATCALRGAQKESGWRQVPAWVHDLVLSGDLEPVLMRAGEEATRLGLYRARQELLSSLPSAPTPEGEAK